MSVDDGIRNLIEPREAIELGTVKEITGGGLPSLVELHDGREIEPRGLWWGYGSGRTGAFWPFEVDAEVVVLFPGGDPNRALVAHGPVSEPQGPKNNGADAPHFTHPKGFTFRSGDGDSVDSVIYRPFFDGLSVNLNLVKAGADLAKSLMPSAVAPPSTAANTIAINLMITAINGFLTSISSANGTLKGDVDTSKTGDGQAPYCTPVIKASS